MTKERENIITEAAISPIPGNLDAPVIHPPVNPLERIKLSDKDIVAGGFAVAAGAAGYVVAKKVFPIIVEKAIAVITALV